MNILFSRYQYQVIITLINVFMFDLFIEIFEKCAVFCFEGFMNIIIKNLVVEVS